MFRSSGLARVLGTLAVALATVTVTVVSGNVELVSAMRDPLAAQRSAAAKRAPAGTAVQSERYLAAAAHMESMKSFSTAAPSLEETGVVVGTWTNLGPSNVGGRTRALLVQPGAASTWFAAGVAGGVFKTTDAGANWAPLGDTLANMAVNSLVQKIGTPNTILAGTGEGYFNADLVRGAGIFQSLNGGTTWTQIAATAPTVTNQNFIYVNDLVWSAQPASPNVYAATSTGVWRSINSGTTWVQILNPLINGGCLDLVMVGGATDTLLASCGTNTQAKVYRTQGTTAVDVGSWAQTLTESGMGRTTLAYQSTVPNVVYALSAKTSDSSLHAVNRSADGGATWTKVVDPSTANQLDTLMLENAKSKLCSATTDAYGWYANAIAIDPADATGNTVWAGSIDLYRSTNGGVDWAPMSSWWEEGQPQHVPTGQHALVFGGTGGMLVAGDGGVFQMTTAPSGAGSFATCGAGGGTISTAVFTAKNNGYAVTQFNSAAVAPSDTTYIAGTQYSTLKGTDGAGAAGWTRIFADFGGAAAIDPSDPNVIYLVNDQGGVRKSFDGGATFPNHPTFAGGNWSDGLSGTFNDQPAFALDPTNPQRLWIASNRVFRSDDGGNLWTAASDILTGTATAITVAPSNPEEVLVGTSSGQIYRTSAASSTTGSTVWASILPRSGFVSSLAYDPFSSGIAYVTYATFGGVHLWKSTSNGSLWADADGASTTGIPDVPVHSVVVDPTNSTRIYAGSDVGVFVSSNSGTTWAKENTGFPNVITERLLASGANLYAFTHGRGAWRVPFTNTATTTTVGFASPRTTLTEAGTSVVVDVVLSTASHLPLAGAVTVNYASANGTALAVADYAAVSGVLTFPLGTAHGTIQTISVPVFEDGVGEATETMTLTLSAPTGGALLAYKTHTVEIDDDGDPQGLSVGDLSVAETTATASFTVSLYPAPTGTVTVNYTTADGSAVSTPTTGDYTTKTGVLTFAAGVTSQTIPVAIRNDTLAENAETFTVVLSGAVGAPIVDATAVGTITDNDVAGTMQFNSATYTVAETGPTAVITVTRTGGSASAVTVQYVASNGTATAPGDYTAVTGTVTFAAAITSATFAVPIINDTLDEADETVVLTLQNPGGGVGAALGAQTTATLNITDNDVGGLLAFSAATYTGNEGTSLLVTVKRTGGAASGVTVDYASSFNGSAVAPADYAAAVGTLTFAANELQKTFNVPLVAENPILVEGDETFLLTLSNPLGGAVLGAIPASTVTIGDASPKVAFSVAATTVAESAASVVLTVTRTGPTTTAVTVPFTMADGTATAVAVGTNPADYTAAAGNVVIAAGATSKTVSVGLRVDTVVEGPESFTVTLGTPVGGILGTNTTNTINITDNDVGGSIVFSAATFTVQEPLSGVVAAKATVTVKRTGGIASGVTVPWSTSDGTAVAPGDYTTASGVVTFDANIVSKTFTVDVLPDADIEGYESINLTLGTATGGAAVGAQSTAAISIIDSEPAVQFSVTAVTIGEAGPKATFTIKRTGTTTGAITVGIVDLGTGTATLGAGGDYNNVPSSVAMASGLATKTFTVDILQDALLELGVPNFTPETVNLQIGSCTPGCTVGLAKDAVLNIKDDEPLVDFSAATYAVTEGTAKVTLTLKRTGLAAPALTVGLNLTGGTAVGGGVDYNNLPLSVVIPANAVSKTFTIDIVNDLLAESLETITLQVASVTGGFVGVTMPNTTVNITDNEPSIAFVLGTAAVAEPLNTTVVPVKHTVAVKRTGVLTQVSTVDYVITNGTATAGTDFNPFTPATVSGTLTFASGASTVNIVIDILADTLDEGVSENFTITLSNPVAAKLGAIVNATRTITDND